MKKLNTEEYVIKEEWLDGGLREEEKERLYEVLQLAYEEENAGLKIPAKDDEEALLFYAFASGYKARNRQLKTQLNKVFNYYECLE